MLLRSSNNYRFFLKFKSLTTESYTYLAPFKLPNELSKYVQVA